MGTSSEQRKLGLREAASIAEEIFGQEGKNPLVVAAVLKSLAVDDLSRTITDGVHNLCQAAAVAAGS
jgi:hypothetical protein